MTETGFGIVPTDSLTAVSETVSVVLPCLSEIASVTDVVKEAKEDHRYGKRAEEVAARTVLKHHREEGHHKGK